MKGQVGTEYIIILAIVLVVAGLTASFALGLIRTSQSSPGADWNKLESQYASVNIISIKQGPEKLLSEKPAGGHLIEEDRAFQVKFAIAENVQDYNVNIRQGQTILCYVRAPLGAAKGVITSANISCPGQAGKTADILVEVRYSQIRSEKDLEKNAIKFTS